MALRLLSFALNTNIRRLPQYATTLGRYVNTTFAAQHVFMNLQCEQIYNYKQNRRLHVRISDQEAGLQTKREANRNTTILEENEVTDKVAESVKRKDKVVSTKKKMETAVDFGDADSFGGNRESENGTEITAAELEEEEFISRPTRYSRKLRTKEYARLIKDHLNANRINEAISVLEMRMLREDRVKPENYIYNLLISGCAKAGYTRKAFSLYTKMRQRGLKVTGGTFTSLFNACANAPTHLDGLAKAQQLRDNMLEKGYEPNVKNYNAMIKAYGRCGDLQTAYQLADEMLERNIHLHVDTFNFLLQACASDEQQGFRFALLTWHKMLRCRLSPDYYTFNAMLRCVRDCGFGDLQAMQQVIAEIATGAQKPHYTQKGIPQITAGNSLVLSTNSSELELQEIKPTEELELPNLLLPQGQLGSLVALAEVTRPHERFLLLGGLTGYLDLMLAHKITPDIKSFTTMLEVIPPTNAAEKQLLSFVRKIGLKADIDFFNILIKKRSMRFDYESAREVLTMIRTTGLKPDIVTYGVLALGCRSQEQARELLQQMQAADIRMNIAILGAMLRQGCAQKSFAYVNEIMQLCLEESIRPNEAFLRHLHNFHRGCARAIDARHPSTKTPAFKKGHSKFCDKYRLFYEEQGLSGLKLEDAVIKLKERPYAQYKATPETGMEPTKHEQVKRKTKARKYIKKIKIDQLSDDPSESNPFKRIA
ncbi:pentatricopeptide repeat-containing protein 1, mitochondrial [Drosophila innubila]|uniref:pentatricopeptide repeat-containing protein 1, mitochondrial n=1 Tax=Drosophila innubila TaxID=198719 RepID=UPI00148D0DB7|nr:pentatricopeptide repeat-containing protein 1, mitochondrial [Drosophila innubila]